MKLAVIPKEGTVKEIPREKFKVEVGQWHWIKIDKSESEPESELLVCVMKIGSNFVEVRTPSSERGYSEWRVHFNLERFIKMGYLSQDENGVLHIGWRTRAEVDQKTLMELVISEGV